MSSIMYVYDDDLEGVRQLKTSDLSGGGGSVNAPGVNGTSAQAVQGINGGVPVPVLARNVTTKFRDAFESYAPGANWLEVKGTGDLVYVDGNAAGSSYLVISKDPLSSGTETRLDSTLTFQLPVEVALGVSMSQRTLGQEFAVEVVDTDPLLPAPADLAISSISQAASVLTVDTALPHSLSVGRAIGIRDCVNPLANYQALVVATVPSPTQFTVTAGPGGTIPSQTIANPAGAKGFVFFRERLGRANNGASMIFENATVTNASAYIRSESGDGLPSGTVNGNHALTIGTTAPVALVTAAYQYAWTPTTEYRLLAQTDRTQWADVPVDSLAAMTGRLLRTQVCPDPEATYELRFRAVNNKSLTVPVAQIVSAVKTGTTTATINCDRPHNLVAADPVVVYGIRAQGAAEFPNLATATAVASIVSPTAFTIVIGTASTITSYGGYVAKVQGGNLMSALGAASQVIQSATLSTLADNTRQLVCVGSANWAAPASTIGDLVDLVGVRNNTTGATLDVDGPWKIANVSTTSLTLVLPFSSQRTLPADFASVNCGGGVIKRTDMRVSFVRIFDYERQRVEVLPRPASDIAASLPVAINNMPAVTVSSGTVTTVTTVTGVTTVSAVTSANLGAPAIIADVASAALTASATVTAITPTFGASYEVNIPVTAVTGTTPTMDVSIEESDDSGTGWFKVYDFPRITAAGMYRSPKIPMTGNRVRYVQTLGGTTPSFTRAINRLQSSDDTSAIRQLIDRSVVLTTLNSTTPSINVQPCRSLQLQVNIGAATTPPSLQLQGSDDGGTSWYNIGTALAAVANSTVQATVTNFNAQLVRALVSSAGTGVTAGYVLVKGF